jgi:predicted MFS family arabinose efflux permease
MVTYGVANALGSLLVSSCVARQVVAREALVGVASVLQLGLLVFLFVWVPDPQLVVVFFALSALWGMCDALWQTQCACKFCSTMQY